MAAKAIPTAEQLRQLLDYDPHTGRLFWKHRPESMFSIHREFLRWNSRFAGAEAFTSTDSSGYKIGHIHRSKYYAHRVIWVIVNGAQPKSQIDHINGVKSDNRIENLREATAAQNQRNKGHMANNTSGYRGVSWNKRDKKWQALIAVGGKNKNLGCFATPEEAHAAYCCAAEKYHGEFSRVA